MARIGASEDAEQSALFLWIDVMARQYPDSGLDLAFHVPNGGHRHIRTAQRLRAMGVRPGVPDVLLPWARGGYHGLAIELKAAGGRTSAAQRDWLARLSSAGWRAVVCVGYDAAVREIVEYLGLPEGAIPWGA